MLKRIYQSGEFSSVPGGTQSRANPQPTDESVGYFLSPSGLHGRGSWKHPNTLAIHRQSPVRASQEARDNRLGRIRNKSCPASRACEFIQLMKKLPINSLQVAATNLTGNLSEQ
jgi:hypothetical protein